MELNASDEAHLIEIVEEKEELDDGIKQWIVINNSFFVEKFFPAAEKYTQLRQTVNRSL